MFIMNKNSRIRFGNFFCFYFDKVFIILENIKI